MKIKTIAILATAILATGCASKDYIERPMHGTELVYSYPKTRPTWTVQKSEQKDGVYLLIGISHRFSSEKAARDDAMRSAAIEASMLVNRNVTAQHERKISGRATENTPVNGNLHVRITESVSTDQMIAKLQAVDWYLEQWRDSLEEKPYWLAYVKAQVPATVIDTQPDQ